MTMFAPAFVVVIAMIGFALIAARQIAFGLAARRRHARLPVSGTSVDLRQGHANLPTVTIQLPIYNEGQVALDCLRAIAAMDYPKDRFDIQVLDDSTDDTSAHLAPEIDRLRTEGITVAHLHRHSRAGWKAGALAFGLATSTAELVAIFDADFRPPPDFLLQALSNGSHFEDPAVGFVQGRWTYDNESENALTRAQALLLDWQFFVQKPAMTAAGESGVFHGTAGLWRRSTIDAVGGWSGDTLAEDLDLSLRTLLAGWISHYDQDLACPSELPSRIGAFRSQQRRWSRGVAQCLVKFAPDCLWSDSRRRRKIFMGVAGLAGYPLLLFGILLWPAVMTTSPPPLLATLYLVMLMLGIGGIVLGLFVSLLASGRRISRDTMLDVAVASALILGSLPNNAAGFLAGLTGRTAIFDRTPKRGKQPWQPGSVGSSGKQLRWLFWLDLITCVYLMLASIGLIRDGEGLGSLPCLLLAGSLSFVVSCQLLERFRH